MTFRICLLLTLLACAQAPKQVRFLSEMTPLPEETWERCAASQYGKSIRQVAFTWIHQRETILNQITAEKVRNLSNWAKKEMADYELPAFKNQTFRATHIQNNENLLIESVLDTLPSHHPLVTRQLKLYLIYNRKHNTIIDAIVTIRGWAEE
ncbi:MAG: hypothetical protein HOE48_00810 [Candidatus Latescibacteria bacterium]|jgi:hypothetical protein|nr:hypothetical protein [Candidatus Latescibacterota bacterium]MBT4136416.1 hypothetical protein [Candidatus Latescibacterota bacterium]MBT5833124.1 hypothetical protein [Candidatus Latescibacterota bacterium]